MKSCYRSQRRVCSEKRKDISIVKNRKRGGTEVFEKSVEKKIYLTIEITTDITSILCAKKEWKEENGSELLIFEQLDN